MHREALQRDLADQRRQAQAKHAELALAQQVRWMYTNPKP